MVDLKTVFKALADETRLRCVLLVVAEGELCVCEFCHAMAVIQPKISRHLALLRSSHLLQDRKQGQWVHYRLNPDLPPWVAGLLDASVQGAAADARFQEDRRRLKSMSDRPQRCGAID